MSLRLGMILSCILFVAFGALQQRQTRVLELEAHWILVAILPVLVALVVGGYIRSFKGLGFEIQAALKAPVRSADVRVGDVLSDIPEDEKKCLEHLEQMSPEKVQSIRRLSFVSGRRGYYGPDGVQKYLEGLPNLEYLEVTDSNNEFICLLPKRALGLGTRPPGLPDPRPELIERFVRALENGNVPSEFPQSAITTKVTANQPVVEVLRTLRRESVEATAVVAENGQLQGVALARDLEHQIVDQILHG